MIHDMTTYFDAVLDRDMQSMFNGTQEEVLEWLELRREFDDLMTVYVGRTMRKITPEEYIEQFG